jgi:hypothetical protein
MSAAKKGKPNGRLGTKLSEETKSKIAQKLKLNSWMIGNFGKLNPFYGKKHDEETKQKMSERVKESYANGRIHNFTGKKRPKIAEIVSLRCTGVPLSEEHKRKIGEAHKGIKHWNWQGGISNRDIHSLNNPRYKKWRTDVFTRDNFKCRVADSDCDGGLQAHHISRWSDYPELRYDVNNGICLCRAHHPRKRAEEKRLEPSFRKLVSVLKHIYFPCPI